MLWKIEAHHGCIIERFPLRVPAGRDVLELAIAKLLAGGLSYARIEKVSATPIHELVSE